MDVSMSGVAVVVLRLKVKPPKNIEHNALGTKLGRVHMERQDYDRLQTRKLKGLKAVKVCAWL